MSNAGSGFSRTVGRSDSGTHLVEDLIAEEERRRRGEVTTPVMKRCKFGL